MRIPEFTAGESLKATSGMYRARGGQSWVDRGAVTPQVRRIVGRPIGRCYIISYYDCDDDCLGAGRSNDDCCTWLYSDIYC
jgi:hypothetical protein